MKMDKNKEIQEASVSKRWLGLGALIAALVLVLGRFALEPLRSAPQYTNEGMDPFCSVEVFQLKNNPQPLEVAFFGSSVTIWDIMTNEVAAQMGKHPDNVRSLAMQGGTSYQMWQLVKRNPEEFSKLQLAVIELGPRTIDDNLRGDPMTLAIAQTGSLAERWSIENKEVRNKQVVEWVFPWRSVRRSLQSLSLDLIKPSPGLDMYPQADARLYPAYHWHLHRDPDADEVFVSKTTPEDAARRIVSGWKPNPLLDASLKQLLAWLHQRKIKVVLVEMPVHPEVAEVMRGKAKLLDGYNDFTKYLDSLGLPKEQIIKTMDISSCEIPINGLRDYQHLNRTGAKIYSSYLGKKLQTLIN
jgi:hypothetical protein